MTRKQVLVYGYYHSRNAGDDLFQEAYQHLFPDFDFRFTSSINLSQLAGVDAVFFGGGSFLYGRPYISDDALSLLKSKPIKIFYLGIGIEAEIHPMHRELMTAAILIATRSADQVERIKREINKNTSFCPDLVYALQDKTINSSKMARTVLILPNLSVVPNNSSLHWKHAAWGYFKSEFSQFLDWLVDQGYRPHFFSMCRNSTVNDDWATAELVSHMDNRGRCYLPKYDAAHKYPSSFEAITQFFSQYPVIITQRYHGIVLAEMTRTSYIAIPHHDKLSSSSQHNGQYTSYYNSNKQTYIDCFKEADKKMMSDAFFSEYSGNFLALKREVETLI